MTRPALVTPDFKLTLGEQDLSIEPLKKRVIEIVVDQVAHGAASFKVTLDDYDNIFSDGSKKVHEGDSCVIQLGTTVTGIKKLFEGIVTGVKTHRSEKGRTLYIVYGFDGLQALTRGRHRRSWEQIKDSDIASQIANECGLQPDVEDSQMVLPYIAQNDITNLKFLFERAKRIGFELKVEEKRLVFKTPDFSQEPVILRWNEKLADDNTALLQRCDFITTTMNVVKKVIVRSYDPKKAAPIIGMAENVSGDVLANTMTGKDAASKNNPDTTIQISDIPVASQEEADKLAQTILDERAAGYLTGEGKCEGNPNILASHKVKILDIGKELEGEYYVIEAKHVFRVGGRRNFGYITAFTVSRTGR